MSSAWSAATSPDDTRTSGSRHGPCGQTRRSCDQCRSLPLHCPYCAGENLHPHGEVHGAWECHECLRAFGVKLIGLLAANNKATGKPGEATS